MKQDIIRILKHYIDCSETQEAITDELYDTLNRKYLVEPKFNTNQLPKQAEPGLDY